MIVVCSGCSAEYRIDLSKINGTQAWFKCKNCAQNIIVEKEKIPGTGDAAESPSLEELLGDTADTDASPDIPDTDDDDFTQMLNLAESDGEDEAPPETDESNQVSDQEQPAAPKKSKRAKKYLFGLTSKVVFLMIVVSLVPGAIFFTISSKNSHERILSEVDRSGYLAARQLAAQVDEWVDKNLRVLKVAAAQPGIQSMDPDGQEKILKSVQKEYPWIYLMFTTDMSGQNIGRSDGKALRNYADREYVKKIVNGAGQSWQTLIGKTSNKPALVIAVPIIRQGETVGVVAAAMTRSAISERITRFKLSATGSGFLVDQAGLTVAHQDNAFVLNEKNMSSHPLIKAARAGRTSSIEFVDADGKTAIGFTAKTALGWTLAIQQDKQEAFAPLIKARQSAIILMGLTLAVVFLIALLAGRSVVRPLKDLTDVANRISVGDLDVDIEIRANNEIGDLANAITRLQDSIRISISRLERLRK